VTYASRKGSTAAVAEAIGAVLRETGADVHVRPMHDVYNLIAYDAVVIGSAVYNGTVMPQAAQFIASQKHSLKTLPVAYFAVSLALANPDELPNAAHYLDPVYTNGPEIKPVEVALFAGSYQPAAWNLLGRLVLRFSDQPQGDFRNWEEIRRWAAGIEHRLLNTTKE